MNVREFVIDALKRVLRSHNTLPGVLPTLQQIVDAGPNASTITKIAEDGGASTADSLVINGDGLFLRQVTKTPNPSSPTGGFDIESVFTRATPYDIQIKNSKGDEIVLTAGGLELSCLKQGSFETGFDVKFARHEKSVFVHDDLKGAFRTALGIDDTLATRVAANEAAIADCYTKAQTDAKIVDALGAFDKLDYKVADSPPTPTTVVIDGKSEPTQSGVRYMVKHTSNDRYEEYILINGRIYDIGSTGEIDLSAYATTAAMNTALADKQATLVSAMNIKTVNGQSLLGSGNVELFVIKSKTKDNVSVAAGARANVQLQVVAETDDTYQIVGFKRVFFENASTEGANRDAIALQSMSTGGGGRQAQIAVLNTGSAAAKIKVTVECLCMAGALQ